MEGRISFFQSKDITGKKPHFRGFLTINGEDHEFAVWPAKTGNGFSGTYKPKQERPAQAPKSSATGALDDEIPY